MKNLSKKKEEDAEDTEERQIHFTMKYLKRMRRDFLAMNFNFIHVLHGEMVFLILSILYIPVKIPSSISALSFKRNVVDEKIRGGTTAQAVGHVIYEKFSAQIF